MNRTTWLQDRRMQNFRDLLSRWERKELSAMDAGELLGCSERQFRRYRQRYEEEGLDGLADKRLGRASEKRVPVDEIAWMLEQYRTHYSGAGRPSTFTSTCRSGIALSRSERRVVRNFYRDLSPIWPILMAEMVSDLAIIRPVAPRVDSN